MNKLISIIFLIITFLINSCIQPESTITSFDGNQSPIIRKISIDKPSIRTGEFTTISIDAIDPDGGELNYSWHAVIGDLIGSGAVIRYTASYCCVGVNTIRLTVSDNSGAKVSESIDIVITEN